MLVHSYRKNENVLLIKVSNGAEEALPIKSGRKVSFIMVLLAGQWALAKIKTISKILLDPTCKK